MTEEEVDKKRLWHRNYYVANKEKRIEAVLRSRAKHPESAKRASRRYTEKHREKLNLKTKEKYKSDPLYRLKQITLVMVKQNFKRQGVKLDKDPSYYLGCTYNEYKEHIEKLWSDGMNWSNHGKGIGKWELDHKKSCCLFNMSDDDQAKECFSFHNVRPLWYEEHQNKSSQDKRDCYQHRLNKRNKDKEYIKFLESRLVKYENVTLERKKFYSE